MEPPRRSINPGAVHLFGPAGFKVIALPGRDWALLAEFTGDPAPVGIDTLFDRLWHPNPTPCTGSECVIWSTDDRDGLEASRCDLDHAVADARTYQQALVRPRRHGLRGKIAALFGA
jgi:hypothetical protein